MKKAKNFYRIVALCLLCAVLFNNSLFCVLADETNSNEAVTEETETEETTAAEVEGETEAEVEEAEPETVEVQEEVQEAAEPEVSELQEVVEPEAVEVQEEETETEEAQENEEAEETQEPEEVVEEASGAYFEFSSIVKNGYGENYTWMADENHKWYSKPVHEGKDLRVFFTGASSYKIKENNAKLIELDYNGNVIEGNEIPLEYEYAEQKTRWPNETYYSNVFAFKVDASVEGIHYYAMEFTMKNHTYTTDKAVVRVDNSAPYAVIEINSDNQEYAPYYQNNVKVFAQIKEWNLGEGHIKVSGPEGLAPEEAEFVLGDEYKVEGSQYIYEINADYGISGSYVISGEFTDEAGNKTVIGDDKNFIIDKEAPKVSVTFDNNNAKNEKYFNADRTAKVTIVEENIDLENLSPDHFDLDGRDKVSIGSVSGDGKGYSFDVTFSQDGTYAFKSFNFVDKAGHTCEVENADTVFKDFVIDKTAPKVEVNFDNSSFENERYYKADRTATIDIKEVNFKEDLVTLKKLSGVADGVPASTAYSTGSENHQAMIKFDRDGTYGFTIKCEDLAGNVSEEISSNEFVIDKTMPELEITGVDDMSSNNGSVAPVITARDANLKDTLLDVSFVGAKHGVINPTTEKTVGRDIITYKILDLPNDKRNDDFYTLKVSLKDLAGNVVEKNLSYSINRYGSVYFLSNETMAMVNGYYVTKPQNVVITENNVDEINNREVSVTCDGNVKILSEGRGYQAAESTSSGNHSVTYTIGKENFNKDGFYSISIYSEDRATNKQSNQTKNARIEFMVDTTAPAVLVSGLDEGGSYSEGEHEFTVNATDTIGVSKLDVYADSDKLATFSNKDLEKTGGTVRVSIPEKDDAQEIVITTTDYAGNVTRLSYNVVVSMKAETIELKSKVFPNAANGMDESAAIEKRNNYLWAGIFTVIAMTVLGAVSGAIYLKRKNK